MFSKIIFSKSHEEKKYAIHNKIYSVYQVFIESFVSKIDSYINDKSKDKLKKNLMN